MTKKYTVKIRFDVVTLSDCVEADDAWHAINLVAKKCSSLQPLSCIIYDEIECREVPDHSMSQPSNFLGVA